MRGVLTRIRLPALGLVVAVVLSACPSQPSDQHSSAGLVLGQVAPQTGLLVFQGQPQFAAVRLALQQINAAGGVLGKPAQLVVQPDVASAAQAKAAAEALAGAGHADAVIGAPTGGTASFDRALQGSGVVQCLPESYAPLAVQGGGGPQTFRTAPADQSVAPVLAAQLLAGGARNVAVVYRRDPYGQMLDPLVVAAIGHAGGTVTANVAFAPGSLDVQQTVQQLVARKPDAVALLTFGDGAPIVQGLLQAGIKPQQLVGGPGTFLPTFASLVDPKNPHVIDGMTVIGPGGDSSFDALLSPTTRGFLADGAQAYDCAIVIALAAEQARSVDPRRFVSHMAEVTQGKHACASFVACGDLLVQGNSIHYDGASGPLQFDRSGDATVARYAIARFMNGVFTQVSSTDVPAS